MAILFAATEPQSFDSIGTVSETSSSTYIDLDFSRIGLLVSQNNARYIGTLISPQTITSAGGEEIWVHCSGSFNSNGNTTVYPMIYLRDSAGDETGLANSTPGLRAVIQGNLLGSGVVRPTGFSQFDIKIDATGVSYYVEGLLQETVNVNLDGVQFTTVEVARGASTWGCGEVIVSDQSTIGLRLSTNEIVSQGDDDAMTGTYEDVDESTSDDADFVSSATIGENESFNTTSRRPVGTQLVPIAVTATIRGRQGTLSGGPTDFDTFVRIGATRYTIGGAGLPATFGAGAMVVADLNPSTASAWGSEANDIQFGITSKA